MGHSHNAYATNIKLSNIVKIVIIVMYFATTCHKNYYNYCS